MELHPAAMRVWLCWTAAALAPAPGAGAAFASAAFWNLSGLKRKGLTIDDLATSLHACVS